MPIDDKIVCYRNLGKDEAFFQIYVRGYSRKEASESLHMSIFEARCCERRILRKLNVLNRRQLIIQYKDFSSAEKEIYSGGNHEEN